MRCACPIWVQGSLGGEYVRESLNLTVWGAAQERVRGWEASGQIGVIRNETPTSGKRFRSTADAEARNLKPESLKKIKDVIERRFMEYCRDEGFRSLRQLDVDAVREFRNRLVKEYSPNSARRRRPPPPDSAEPHSGDAHLARDRLAADPPRVASSGFAATISPSITGTSAVGGTKRPASSSIRPSFKGQN